MQRAHRKHGCWKIVNKILLSSWKYNIVLCTVICNCWSSVDRPALSIINLYVGTVGTVHTGNGLSTNCQLHSSTEDGLERLQVIQKLENMNCGFYFVLLRFYNGEKHLISIYWFYNSSTSSFRYCVRYWFALLVLGWRSGEPRSFTIFQEGRDVKIDM